jgi:hypothetical protein
LPVDRRGSGRAATEGRVFPRQPPALRSHMPLRSSNIVMGLALETGAAPAAVPEYN